MRLDTTHTHTHKRAHAQAHAQVGHMHLQVQMMKNTEQLPWLLCAGIGTEHTIPVGSYCKVNKGEGVCVSV